MAARCDLETGKSLNIAAPGWQKTFDALRDWQNHENGWSRPDDPERARDVQPGHRAYIEAAQLRAGLEAEKDKLQNQVQRLEEAVQDLKQQRKGRVHPIPRSLAVEGAGVERAGVGAEVEQGALVRGDGSEARGDSGRAAARAVAGLWIQSLRPPLVAELFLV